MVLKLPLKEVIYFTILTIALLLGSVNFRKLTLSSRAIYCLLVVTILSELSSEICATLIGNNMFVFHIYNPLKGIIIIIAFNFELRRTKLFSILGVLFISFAVINGLIWQPFLEQYCSYTFNINVVLITSISLFYLYKLLNEETDNRFTEYPLFWISVGYLIYNCINILGLGAFNTLSTDNNLSYILEVVRTFSNYLLYALFIVAFLSKQKSLTVT